MKEIVDMKLKKMGHHLNREILEKNRQKKCK